MAREGEPLYQRASTATLGEGISSSGKLFASFKRLLRRGKDASPRATTTDVASHVEASAANPVYETEASGGSLWGLGLAEPTQFARLATEAKPGDSIQHALSGPLNLSSCKRSGSSLALPYVRPLGTDSLESPMANRKGASPTTPASPSSITIPALGVEPVPVTALPRIKERFMALRRSSTADLSEKSQGPTAEEASRPNTRPLPREANPASAHPLVASHRARFGSSTNVPMLDTSNKLRPGLLHSHRNGSTPCLQSLASDASDVATSWTQGNLYDPGSEPLPPAALQSPMLSLQSRRNVFQAQVSGGLKGPHPPAAPRPQQPQQRPESGRSQRPALSGLQLLALHPKLPANMERGTWCLEDYHITARIYKGAHSSVYKATCLHSGLRVALKVYSLDRVPSNLVHTLVREVRIHADLQHRSIIGLYGVFQEDHRLVLVQERADRGDLYHIHRGQLGSRMSEPQLAEVVLAPLMEALAYLHAKGVCHRDIKPENLLMAADGTLRLADFGAAINIAEERAVTRTGTADYMAPEVERCPLKALPEENKDNASLAYTTAADIWSVGVLAFEMLCGFPPFASPDPYTEGPRVTDDELLNRAASAAGLGGQEAPRFLHFPHFVSDGARSFISSCLVERPAGRPTALQLLAHPWFRAAIQVAAAAADNRRKRCG